uniref:Uncharacterized protein n=1 Tax=Rhizophora mucronata TaxID=61149 RepID=A0A2P2PY63_RHIMU
MLIKTDSLLGYLIKDRVIPAQKDLSMGLQKGML